MTASLREKNQPSKGKKKFNLDKFSQRYISKNLSKKIQAFK